MEDICYDQMIGDTRKGRTVLLRVLMIIGALLLGLSSFIFPIPIGETYFPWFPIALAVDFVALRLLWSRVAVEYEYCFTDGQVDIDAIYSQRMRKRKISFDCKDIALMAPKEEVKYQTIFQREYDTEFKFTDGSEEQKDAYIIILKKPGKTAKITFQPDKRMQNLFKKYAPHNVVLEGSVARPFNL